MIRVLSGARAAPARVAVLFAAGLTLQGCAVVIVTCEKCTALPESADLHGFALGLGEGAAEAILAWRNSKPVINPPPPGYTPLPHTN